MRMLGRAFDWLTAELGALSGLGTLAIMVVVVIDVTGRALFNAPLPGGNEFCELLLVGMIFLGLAAAQRKRQHFEIEMAILHLPPALRRWVDVFRWLVSVAVVGLLAWLSARQAWSSLINAEASYGTVSFPLWPARLVLAFGLALLAVQYAMDTAKRALGRDV